MKQRPLCETIQARISHCRDTGIKPDAETMAHVQACTECSAFFEYASNLGAIVREDAESKARLMKAPDFSAQPARTKETKPGIRLSFAWSLPLGAALAASIIIAAVFFTRASDSQSVAKNTEAFVESIIGGPVLLDSSFTLTGSEMTTAGFFEESVMGDEYAAQMIGLTEFFTEEDT